MEQNLNLYHVFYEVANCHNFSIAAKKMYISQPAISKSISKLEENLHTVLFHRSSKGVTLTREGEILYRYVEQALFSLRSGEEQLKTSASFPISQLSIGVSTTLCKYVLLPVLKDFMTQNPNIKITISCQPTLDTISALQEGSIDIGLVGIPSKAEETDNRLITYLPIKTIEDIFVATPVGKIINGTASSGSKILICTQKATIRAKYTGTNRSAESVNFFCAAQENHCDKKYDKLDFFHSHRTCLRFRIDSFHIKRLNLNWIYQCQNFIGHRNA